MGKNFDGYINHGQAGAGNQYILHKLTESHAQNQIKATDTVAIMWSTVIRYDNWYKGEWSSTGNVFASGYTQDFLQHIDPIGFFIRDLSFIHAAKQLLASIGCRMVFFSITPLDHFSEKNVDSWRDRLVDKKTISRYKKIYKDVISTILPSAFEILWKNDWNSRISDLRVPQDKSYDVFAGPDWPTLEELESGTCNEKNYKLEIIQEMCDVFHAVDFNQLKDLKLYIVKDMHPTPQMHLEYLDKVLPNWRTWK